MSSRRSKDPTALAHQNPAAIVTIRPKNGHATTITAGFRPLAPTFVPADPESSVLGLRNDDGVIEVPLEATLALREAVLSKGHPGRPVIWPYDHDDDARNFGLFEGDELVACVSVGLKELEPYDPADAFRFHSMAVAEAFQRQGLGNRLLAELVAQLREEGAKLIWATARDSAVGFYTNFGMEVLPARTFVVPETGFECHYVVLR